MSDQGPKVLLAGMHFENNNFTRQLRNMGCQVFWWSASNPRRAMPAFCDAVLIAKCQISHEAHKLAKDTYISRGKPVFIADHSFSTVRERISNWLTYYQPVLSNDGGFQSPLVLKAGTNQVLPNKVLDQEVVSTLFLNTNQKETSMSAVEPHRGRIKGQANPKYSKDERKKFRRRLKELLLDGMLNRDELCAQLTKDGFKAPGGLPLTRQTVQSQCNHMGRIARVHRSPKQQRVVEQVESTMRSDSVGTTVNGTTVPQVSRDVGTNKRETEQAMMDLILEAELTPEQKVAMLKGLRT